MKKITELLGASHSQFDHQMKDAINDILESISKILINQSFAEEYQKKIFIQQNLSLQIKNCDYCTNKSNVVITNINNGTNINYCDDCLNK